MYACSVYHTYLHPKNAKDDEECTTDEDNVADGFEGSDEGLHYQLQTRSSANHPEERRSSVNTIRNKYNKGVKTGSS